MISVSWLKGWVMSWNSSRADRPAACCRITGFGRLFFCLEKAPRGKPPVIRDGRD
jgi:hypothetical protein